MSYFLLSLFLIFLLGYYIHFQDFLIIELVLHFFVPYQFSLIEKFF